VYVDCSLLCIGIGEKREEEMTYKDITFCSGAWCKDREKCYRYMGNLQKELEVKKMNYDEVRISLSDFSTDNELKKKDKCDYFIVDDK
jgi:hypothetical protein